ncbi:MAG: hypothetical protein ACI8S6_002009 [Myxococcota bacterium]|jgi:hypothetical protein
MLKHMLLLGAGALALASCDGSSEGITLGGEAEGCTLSWETIAGTEWLFLKANPDKTEVADIKTRLRFVAKEGKTVAQYNVGSLSDFYDYPCEMVGEELICKQEPNVQSWCTAILANGKECTATTLRAEAPELTDEEIAEGKKLAEAEYAKYKGTPNEARFKAEYGNLGNKLRGVLYIKIDSRNCRLRVTDMYKFYYQGKWGEDSNPAGINPFVKNELGDLLWESCDNPLDLVDLRAATYPSDPANVRNMTQHPPGTEVHYWFLNTDWSKPAEGCTFGYDIWHNGKPSEQNQSPNNVDGTLQWHYSRTFPDASAPGEAEVSTIVATKTCAGKEPETIVSCNALLVKP